MFYVGYHRSGTTCLLFPKCFSNKYKPNRTWRRFFFKLLVMFRAFITPLLFCWFIDVFRREALRLV